MKNWVSFFFLLQIWLFVANSKSDIATCEACVPSHASWAVADGQACCRTVLTAFMAVSIFFKQMFFKSIEFVTLEINTCRKVVRTIKQFDSFLRPCSSHEHNLLHECTLQCISVKTVRASMFVETHQKLFAQCHYLHNIKSYAKFIFKINISYFFL